jgi:hypothetical protein
MGGRRDVVLGLGPIAGLLDLISFPQRRSVAASCLVDPFVPALESDRLAAADAVHELIEIVITLRAAGLRALGPLMPVGVTTTAGTTIGTAPFAGVFAMIAAPAAVAAALAVPTAAALAVPTATGAITSATAAPGQRGLPIQRWPAGIDAHRQCGQH